MLVSQTNEHDLSVLLEPVAWIPKQLREAKPSRRQGKIPNTVPRLPAEPFPKPVVVP